MPTLLQINVTANWGSTGKIAEQIGICAQEHGWESYIAYGRMMNPSKSKLIKVGTKIDNCIHYACDRLLDLEGLSSVCSSKSLVRAIEKIKPDVIQLHNIHDHWLNYKVLFEYLNQTEIPVVWTFHDCWAFTGHCYHFVQQKCMKWETECMYCCNRNRITDRSRQNYNLKKKLFSSNNNLTIIPCSQWMGEFVKNSFLKDKRIHVIHNGINLDIFKPIKESNSIRCRDKFRVIAVSNVWLPYKGINDVYELRRLLSAKFEIIIVGLSERQLMTLPSGIKGISHTQDIHELVRLYNEADVLINPTYADTFPTVNLEALACGTPVITYQTGGSPEAVDDKTGIVVEQGNVEALADAIRQLQEVHLSSEDCRKRAEMYFDKDKCFEEYIRLYNSFIH